MALLDPSRRRLRRWLLLLAAAGLSGYGAYRLYHLPSVAEKRRKLSDLLRSLASVSHALAQSADALSLVSSDLNRFLSSDSDEIPNSLRQISKLARSDDLASALSRLSEAVTVGIVRGSNSDPPDSPGLADRVIDKVISPAGTGFVSVIAGSFARNLVVAFYSSGDGHRGGVDEERPLPEWVRIACSEEVRRLMGECVETFVSTAVEVYLKKTEDVNTYDEMFSGLTNPTHGERMKEVLVSVCSGAMETLVKTSHEVLTGSKTGTSAPLPQIEDGAELCWEDAKKDAPGEEGTSGGVGGWLKGVSSTLAVPSNRKFVLDVTGRVTFETVKSVLEFLFWKTYSCASSGARVVSHEIVERGLEVVRYVSAKSMLILTICFSMLLHLAFGSRLLVTAA